MKNYDKNVESSYLIYLDGKNLHRWAMSQKIPVVEDLSQFEEDFIKSYDENCDKVYFPDVDVEYPSIYLIFIDIYHFYLKERKSENVISLFVTLVTKKT